MKTKIALMILSFTFFHCKPAQQNGTGGHAIENTYWRLAEVSGQPVVTPQDGREVYMILSREDNALRLKGHGGCNGLGGDYRVDGRNISFQAITTRMYCESQMAVENAFTQMLSAADNYRIRGSTLELYKGETLLGKFTAKRA